MKRLNFYFILMLLTASCDCVQHASGYIVDYNTKKPIDNVTLGKQINNLSNSSDSAGYFEYRGISGGFFGCPNLELHFSKEGYEMHKQKFNNCFAYDTVYLVKIR